MSNSSLKRILLVDDDEDDREIFLEVITEIDPSAELITAINGADGFDKLSSGEAPPHVIFLDLNMPIMSGTEFLRKVKSVEKLKNIPIVILTTSNDEWAMKEVQALGAGEFVTKPSKFKDWRTVLKKHILEKN